MEPNLFWLAPSVAILLFALTFRRYKKPPPAPAPPPDLADLARHLIAAQRLAGDVEIDERELQQALELLDPDQIPGLAAENPESALAVAEAFFQQGGPLRGSSPEAAQTARHRAIFSFLRNDPGAEAAYAAAQSLDPAHPAIATQLGALALRRGDPQGAQKAYETALDLAQKAGDKLSSAIALGNLGILQQAQGDLAAAEELHRKALAENQTIHRQGGIATQCSCLGIIFHLNGDHDRAQRFRREALSVSDHAAHEHELIELYERLARHCENRNDLEGASSYLLKALSIHETLGEMMAIARQHEQLGALAKRRGKVELAQQHWARAQEIFEAQGDNASAERVKDTLAAIAS